MKSISLSIYLLLTTVSICHAQKYGLEKADSLIGILQEEKTDIGRIKLMTDISLTLYCHDNKRGLDYANNALSLSNKIGYKKGIGLAYHAAGVNYIFRGDFPQSIANLAKGQAIFEKEGDNAMLARCYMQIAAAHQFVMHNDTALSYGNKAIQLFTQIKDSMGLAECYRIIGFTYEYEGTYDTAITLFNKALAISRQKGWQEITGWLLADLGGTYAGQNNYVKALSYSFDAMKLLEKLHGGFLSIPIGNIGYMYLQTKDYVKAKMYIQKAANVAEKQNDIYRTAASLSLLGSISLEEKEYAAALKNFRRSLELMKQINSPGDIAASYGLVGDAYHRIGEYALSFDYLFVALQMSTKLNDKWHANYYLYVIGNVYLQLFKNKTASLPLHPKIPHNKKQLLQLAGDYLIKAKAMALEAGDIDDLVLILKDLSDLKLAQGDPAAALDAYKESDKYDDSVNTLARSTYFARKELEYEYGKQQDSLALVADKKAAVDKAELKLQQKATEQERRNKTLAVIVVIVLLGVLSIIYYLFLQRRKLSDQLAASLTTLKATQTQLISIEKEKEAQKIRLGISRDLHDNVGSTLSGIAMYSHLAKEQVKNLQKEEIENSLNIIQSNAGEMVNKLNDIVWLINPGQDSLQKLMQRLEDYAIQIAAVKNIRVKSNLNGHHSENILPADTRRNIYLLFKEAINNAVKYSDATVLELYVQEQDGSIKISLNDNGNGFDIGTVNHGNGLDNMEQRAKEMEANCNIESEIQKGTSITVTIPIP